MKLSFSRKGLLLPFLLLLVQLCASCSAGSGAQPNSPDPFSTRLEDVELKRASVSDFLGNWFVHGEQLRIDSLQSGLLRVENIGVCQPNVPMNCQVEVTLKLELSGDELRASAEDIKYLLNGQIFSEPDRNRIGQPGDSLSLGLLGPNLMHGTILKGFDLLESGNPYWCKEGIEERFSRYCGL